MGALNGALCSCRGRWGHGCCSSLHPSACWHARMGQGQMHPTPFHGPSGAVICPVLAPALSTWNTRVAELPAEAPGAPLLSISDPKPPASGVSSAGSCSCSFQLIYEERPRSKVDEGPATSVLTPSASLAGTMACALHALSTSLLGCPACLRSCMLQALHE